MISMTNGTHVSVQACISDVVNVYLNIPGSEQVGLSVSSMSLHSTDFGPKRELKTNM